MKEFQHEPVLIDDVLRFLQVRSKEAYIDCTLGGAGHSLAILKYQPDITLVGIDQDEEALQHARERLAPFGAAVHFVHDNFANLVEIAAAVGIHRAAGVLMDIGVSSYQLDEGGRGFSYQHDAPLDMRMNPRDAGETAYDLVNQWSQKDLAHIIATYGEERWAARIAKFIVERRSSEPIRTTGQLVEVIKAAIPAGARREGPHPAKRTFQALRIAVNKELEVLEKALAGAVQILKPQGRLVVITFHSLEDRIVKEFFRSQSSGCICPPNLPVCRCGFVPTVKVLTRKPVTADQQELSQNPRARSAKLRAAERM